MKFPSAILPTLFLSTTIPLPSTTVLVTAATITFSKPNYISMSRSDQTYRINDLTYSPDGSILGSASKHVILYNVSTATSDTGEDSILARFDYDHGIDGAYKENGLVGSIALTHATHATDGIHKLVTCGSNSIIRIRQSSDGTNWETVQEIVDGGTPCAVSPDGTTILSGLPDGQVGVYSLSSDSSSSEYTEANQISAYGAGSTLHTITYDPSGSYFAIGAATLQDSTADGQVKVYDASTWQLLHAFDAGYINTPWDVEFNPDGSMLAIATRSECCTDGSPTRGEIFVYSIGATGGNLLATLEVRQAGFPNEAKSLTFSPDGKFLYTGHDGHPNLVDSQKSNDVYVHDTETWQVVHNEVFYSHDETYDLVFRPTPATEGVDGSETVHQLAMGISRTSPSLSPPRIAIYDINTSFEDSGTDTSLDGDGSATTESISGTSTGEAVENIENVPDASATNGGESTTAIPEEESETTTGNFDSVPTTDSSGSTGRTDNDPVTDSVTTDNSSSSRRGYMGTNFGVNLPSLIPLAMFIAFCLLD